MPMPEIVWKNDKAYWGDCQIGHLVANTYTYSAYLDLDYNINCDSLPNASYTEGMDRVKAKALQWWHNATGEA